jgi:hypothetical protein
MPDHLAELSRGQPPGHVGAIVAERVEPDIATARARALAYFESGLLTSEGAKLVEDRAVTEGPAPGHVLTVRWGAPAAGRIESLALQLLAGKVVEVLSRYPENDPDSSRDVDAIRRSLRCDAPR